MGVEGTVRNLLRAVRFAAQKHRDQRRKGVDASPYINHPIDVAELISRVGRVDDPAVLIAAVLHDTVEDTETTLEEVEREFGADVRNLVAEMTDDKSLPKAERKRLQVEYSPELSDRAKIIKIADKACNVWDIAHWPPQGWTAERKAEYLEWARRVVEGCRGTNEALEEYFDRTVEFARRGHRAARRQGDS